MALARAKRRVDLRLIGLLPFMLFVGLFLILPTLYIVVGAFRTPAGGFTFQNILDLNTPNIRSAYWVSIKISFASALIGCIVGFGMAAAITVGGLPKRAREPLLTFSGVASNFAGVPLAFAFIATIGPAGLITLWLKNEMGINLRAYGWNLLSTPGLILTYLFFQIQQTIIYL
jgi:putative spermidine/putrescine transport system permease protein